MISAVETRDLTVMFGEFTAVKKVSFSVNRGEIFGFLGANGAGKTTTIRVLCGLLIPTSGKAIIAGDEVNEANFDQIKSKVGYMSQKFTLYNDLTVDENLSFAADLRKIPRDIFKVRKDEVMNFIGFSKSLNTMVSDLPGGMKQQVSLAASVLHDPEIIFLDEPTAGVSPYSRSIFWNLIRDLAKRGKTIFVTSHYMDEVEQCGRIALMKEGQIIALDGPENLKQKTFPDGLIELSPKSQIDPARILEIKALGVFSSLEQHGLQYHATIGNDLAWKSLQIELLHEFEIRTIKPSLEDVFIRQVEGGN